MGWGYFTNLFIRSIKSADLIHSQEFDLCCRGLIYQAHLIFDFIKGMIDESNPYIKKEGRGSINQAPPGENYSKKGAMVSFSSLLYLILSPNERKRMTIFLKLWRKKAWILMNLS